MSDATVFNFPCEYPIKIFSKKDAQAEQIICAIVQKHTDKLDMNNITTKQSTKGTYISFTMRIIATSREQIDTINKELQDCSLVAYVL